MIWQNIIAWNRNATADEYLAQSIAMLHYMATLISFHCYQAHMNRIIPFNILSTSEQNKIVEFPIKE